MISKGQTVKTFYIFQGRLSRSPRSGVRGRDGLPRLRRVDTFREPGTGDWSSYRQELRERMRELGRLREARRSLAVTPDQTINIVDIRDR